MSISAKIKGKMSLKTEKFHEFNHTPSNTFLSKWSSILHFSFLENVHCTLTHTVNILRLQVLWQKQISTTWRHSWCHTESGWGSHDSVPGAIARHND